MLKAIQPSTDSRLEQALCPALRIPAVAHCAAVFESVYQSLQAQGKSEYSAECKARKAFRAAMPPLSGYQNICDYIACAGHGMVIGAIEENSGTKLLYAAQLALNAISRQPKPQAGGGAAGCPPLSSQPHENNWVIPPKTLF